MVIDQTLSKIIRPLLSATLLGILSIVPGLAIADPNNTILTIGGEGTQTTITVICSKANTRNRVFSDIIFGPQQDFKYYVYQQATGGTISVWRATPNGRLTWPGRNLAPDEKCAIGSSSLLDPHTTWWGKHYIRTDAWVAKSATLSFIGAWGIGDAKEIELRRPIRAGSQSQVVYVVDSHAVYIVPPDTVAVIPDAYTHLVFGQQVAPGDVVGTPPNQYYFISIYDSRPHVLQKIGGEWNEFIDGTLAFTFHEYDRDNSFIYVEDKSRNVSLALPLNNGPQAFIRFNHSEWKKDITAVVVF